MPSAYPTLRLEGAGGGWAGDDVVLATGFVGRLLGSRRSGGPVLLCTSSVHTMWMRCSITVVFLDSAGTILSVRVVPPLRVVRHRGAAWALELPGGHPAPPPGRLQLFLRR